MKLSRMPLSVSHICSNRSWYKINRTYQRESDLWSLKDKQHLIDTILKDYDIPKFYIRKLGEYQYEIVDGQHARAHFS